MTNPGSNDKARALTSDSRINTRNCPTLKKYLTRSFLLTFRVLKYLNGRGLSAVELSIESGISYATAQRILLAGREEGVIVFHSFGKSASGAKPIRWTLSLPER